MRSGDGSRCAGRAVSPPTNSVQPVHVGDDGLIRRSDYGVDIMAGGLGAHYFTGYTQSAGITLPTAHRILPRAP
ncbi:hypothetical protein ACFCXH_26795 [Streptomyces nojiriensis]|uniref:hypothetical protein n=1 Tax=Streptomyces nojiriensis TaxID=66374 RepID=UPI0035DB6813